MSRGSKYLEDEIVIPKKKVFDAKKERFNPYQTGYGAHKDKSRYQRRKVNQDLGRIRGLDLAELEDEILDSEF